MFDLDLVGPVDYLPVFRRLSGTLREKGSIQYQSACFVNITLALR